MKKTLIIILSFAIILLLAACSTPTAEKKPESTLKPEIVVFNDEALEAKVREAMKKPSGDITVVEAEAVEYLDLKEYNPSTPSPRIKDISALKYFKNLKGLDLSYNLIEDLSPISGLTQLEGLGYWGAESVSDFSGLAGLTNMLDICIAGTQGDGIKFNNTDMQNLAGMTKIEMIWIQGAKELTDISVVANFKKLYKLNVDYTGVSDISPAAGIISLVEMDLTGSKVRDVSPLKNLVNLKKLFLKDCPVTDYSPLKGIYPNLEEKDFKAK